MTLNTIKVKAIDLAIALNIDKAIDKDKTV